MGSISEMLDSINKEIEDYKTALEKSIIENRYDIILKHRDRVDKLGLRSEQIPKSLYDISKIIEAAIEKISCEECLNYNYCYLSSGSGSYKEQCLSLNKKDLILKDDDL